MLSYGALLCVALATANAMQLTRFADCGSKGGKINSITVEGCDQEPCQARRNHDYGISVNFTASQDSAEGHTSLHGIIAGTELPFPISPSNACTKGLTCPIVAGQSHIYSVSLHCPFFAPTLKLASKWQLKDANSNDILCFIIPLEITG